MRFKVVGLRIYPIKSCGGIDLPEMRIDGRGPLLDRQWMLVDPAGKFITQRQTPRLSEIRCAIEDRRLTVGAPGMSQLVLADLSHWAEPQPPQSRTRTRIAVRVWKDELRALEWDANADQWFSEFLGERVRLVEADQGLNRMRVKGDPARNFQVKFADSAPFLLINLASLRALESELSFNQLDPDRFRANIIVDGPEAWVEDDWTECHIGEIRFPLTYACDRCVIVNVDPATAQINPSILRGLAAFRKKSAQPINFGMRMVHQNAGVLRIGAQLLRSS